MWRGCAHALPLPPPRRFPGSPPPTPAPPTAPHLTSAHMPRYQSYLGEQAGYAVVLVLFPAKQPAELHRQRRRTARHARVGVDGGGEGGVPDRGRLRHRRHRRVHPVSIPLPPPVACTECVRTGTLPCFGGRGRALCAAGFAVAVCGPADVQGPPPLWGVDCMAPAPLVVPAMRCGARPKLGRTHALAARARPQRPASWPLRQAGDGGGAGRGC
jgi:hypothetical protein